MGSRVWRAARSLALQVEQNRDRITLGDQGFAAPDIPAWAALRSSLPGWPGDCSFCWYSTGDMTRAPTCERNRCPKRTKPFDLYRDDDVACFDNYKQREDRLCILRDFEEGRANIEAMPLEAREQSLRKLLAGAVRDAEARGQPTPEMACLNPAEFATVAWTHVHLFPEGLNPDKGAHGGVEDHAYCVALGEPPGAK